MRAIANDLVVQLPTDFTRNDSEIAQAALNALKWNIHVPADRLSLCGGVPAAGNFASRWC